MRILLVEDDPVLLSVVQRSLSDAGHRVEVASDLATAAHWWRVQPFDAVLLDLNLPLQQRADSGMGSGLNLLREMRSRGDRTPVLVLTARNRTDERIAGLDAGADDYLGKPFELAEVEARLRALVRRSQGADDVVQVGQLQLERQARRVRVHGLELTLPAPLAKRAAQPMPLLIASRVLAPAKAGSASQRDQLNVELGQVVSAVYVRDLSGPSPRALRGSLALGTGAAPPTLPEQGVAGVARFDELSLDAWQALWPAGSGLDSDDANAAWASYLPNRLGLQAARLTTEGRTLHEVVAGITREGMNWRASIDARELSGHAQYTPASRQQGARLYARLAKLNLPPSAVGEVESLLEAPPTAMPALDIQIDELVLRGKRIGKVEIEAVNLESRAPRASAAAREWQLNKFNVLVPEATLRAHGRWAAASDNRPRRTEMHFRLEVQDAGALLTRLGTPGALRAGNGQLEGQVGWNGSPLAWHYPSMQGQFRVQLKRGQFLKADPGVAKLLGVLSLQGLPRRLLLDFRDVFAEGFAFDTLQGDVQIQGGIASTQNLHIEGVNAVVRMEGSADLAKETQQLKVLILPQLDAGGASVVAGLAVNPAFGLTAFLAQWLLKIPLSKATIQEFAVDGSWIESRVTRLNNPEAAPANRP